MNAIEHLKLLKEEIEGMFFGTVIQVETEDTRRVKVRVFGVYNEPISIEHIPWALPILDDAVPILGDIVGIFFVSNDLTRPIYFPSAKLESAQIQKKRDLYQTIIDAKKTSVKTSVDVGGEFFSEPETEANNTLGYDKHVLIIPEDVASTVGEGVDQGSPTKGLVIEKDLTEGKERVSVTHPSGTFIEMHSDGSIVIHSIKDIYVIADGEENSLVGGKWLKKVIGKAVLDSPDINLGSDNFQPLLKGDDYDTFEKDLIDKIGDIMVLTALGPQPIIPIPLAAIIAKKIALSAVYSTVSNTE